jgi:uncharacterized phosphosugar-binding protein
MEPILQFLQKSREIIDTVALQKENIEKAALLCAESILKGRLVHLFGSGHSRIMIEEMWPRYGSFPGFNPIVELSLSFHNLVVGANGQRQAMFLENVSGLAERILRNFDLSEEDTAIIVSSSGCNIVPIEMAQIFQKNGIKVISIVSKQHLEKSISKKEDRTKLSDYSDIVLDTGAPVGDAMVNVPGLSTPVAPGSTVGGALLINCLKAEIANNLVKNGKKPKVLTGSVLVGQECAEELFESAYDEHAHLMSKLYVNLGNKFPPNEKCKSTSN